MNKIAMMLANGFHWIFRAHELGHINFQGDRFYVTVDGKRYRVIVEEI
jgi:hypothetical protein